MSKPPLHTFKVLSSNRFIGELAGQAIGLYRLSNSSGSFVNICNYGARVVQIVMPNAHGVLGDVALGFEDLAGLMRASPSGVPSMGAFIGRYANRIAHGRFVLDGKAHQLDINSGEHCIHGGQGGSRHAVFKAVQTASNQLELSHTFTPNTDGFPGHLKVFVTYTLSDDNALSIAWQASALDAPTVANFTSHIFFNLSGTGTVDAHCVQLNAAHYLPLTTQLIPTGQLLPVANTPFDFLRPKVLGDDIHSAHPQIALCAGYDHHFVVSDWNGALRHIATVSEPSSGRAMRVFSSEPGAQLFTGNGLDKNLCGFARHGGLCVEPSYFPDSPNQAHFPSTRLAAGQTRNGEIIYAFAGDY